MAIPRVHSRERAAGPASFDLLPRPCPSCAADEPEPLWRQDVVTGSRAGGYRFDVRVSGCTRCGCVYASPAPSQQALNAYYADSHAAFAGADPDFSVPARVELLRGIPGAGGTFVEVGANAAGPFREELDAMFGQTLFVEPNSDCDSDATAIEELQPGRADVLAHYFVLEHVVDVQEFLGACRRALRPGGHMVCEVPDLHLYPRDASALLLHEHVNHFSVGSLARAAARWGFELVEASHALCSRGFGFAAVFEARHEPGAPAPEAAPSELAHSRSCVHAGAAMVDRYRAGIARVQEEIRALDGRPAVIWAANDVMTAIVEGDGFELPGGVVLVDSDPAKDSLPGGHPVSRPEEARAALAEAELLVICTPHHAQAIAEQASALAGRVLREEVVGSVSDLPPVPGAVRRRRFQRAAR